jgi:hypothetical protein
VRTLDRDRRHDPASPALLCHPTIGETMMLQFSTDDTWIRELVHAISRRDRTRAEPYPVGVGGGWQADVWRDDLSEALTKRVALLAIRMRTNSTHRVLPDQTWTDVTVRLARLIGSFERDPPWVALRTSARTVNLIARTPRTPTMPSLIEFQRDVEQRYGLLTPAPSTMVAPTIAGSAAPTTRQARSHHR